MSKMIPDLYDLHANSLKADALRAMAWGSPDSESTGYTSGEFIRIIRKLLDRIEYLENQLKEPKGE